MITLLNASAAAAIMLALTAIFPDNKDFVEVTLLLILCFVMDTNYRGSRRKP